MIDDAMLRKVIAANITRLRKERGLSQQKLAERAGIARITIAKIETEESLPSAAVLFSIADSLSVSTDSLRQVAEMANSRSA